MELKRKKIVLTHTAQEITGIIEAPVLGATGIQVTSNGHDLSDGDTVTIDGTVSNDGTGTVSSSATNTFEVDIAHGGDETIGIWVKEEFGAVGQDAEQYDEAVLYTDVTAWTGGSLVVGLDTSPDGGTTWYTLGSGSSLGSVTTQRVAVAAPIGKLVRVTDTLASTPEMSFTIRLELARRGG